MKESIQKTIETYNRYSKVYGDYHDEKLMQFQLTKFISLLKGKRILDIGCGCGRDVCYFKDEGYEATGIDICENMINEAKNRYSECKFIRMDMIDMDFEDEEFDGIWMMATLSNIEKKDAGKVLSEIKRILKNKGILYIAVKQGEGEGFIKKKEFNDEEIWYAYYKQEELETLLKEMGFVILGLTVANDDKTDWIEIFVEKRG